MPAGFRLPLQAFKIGANIRSVLITQVAVFFQRFADDAFKLRRQIGIQPHRGDGRAVQYGIENCCGAVAAEWRLAGSHLVQN
jgi:hypothetical protein